MISTIEPLSSTTPLRRLFDSIGPTVYPDRSGTVRVNLSIISFLFVVAATALLLIAIGQTVGRHNYETVASLLVWGGVFIMVIPFASRIANTRVARGERLFLLILLAESLFVYKTLYSPIGFSGYDEFAHWVTASDILYRHQLFLGNSLLPVSAYYPGLEILTTAFANLAGISVFPAACIVLAVLRILLVTGLFLFFERLTSSERLAAIATLLYMGATTFVLFDAGFSYESLGVVLVVLIMWSETLITPTNYRSALLPVALFAALTITHHASSFLCVAYLIGIMIIEMVRHNESPKFSLMTGFAVFGIGLIFLWVSMPENPVSTYLSSAFYREVNGFLAVVKGHAAAHAPFESMTGHAQQPLWLRTIGIISVLLISIGLATGFFRALTWGIRETGWRRFIPVLRREWPDSRIILLTIGAFGYPVSVLFRLSSTGWEIGDRMTTWVYLSVGLVVAISLVHYWQARPWWSRSATNFVIAVILLGGIIIGSGTHAVRGPYVVAADSASIEPMGIAAAKWTHDWLGSGNTFGTDRVNQLLLATYGDQDVVTDLAQRSDASWAILTKAVGPDALQTIKHAHLTFLEVDLRLSTDLPELGAYFVAGEFGNGRTPPSITTLLKYDKVPDAARVFDNGYIVIYDVGRMQ